MNNPDVLYAGKNLFENAGLRAPHLCGPLGLQRCECFGTAVSIRAVQMLIVLPVGPVSAPFKAFFF